MSSRDRILNRLRLAQKPFTDVPEVDTRLPVVKMEGNINLPEHFTQEATKIHCHVWQMNDEETAIEKILELVGDDKEVLTWDFDQIPVRGLLEALSQEKINVAAPDDPDVFVGITGVSAALASTGSLVMLGKSDTLPHTSLLPTRHIAVVKHDQILPNLEAFFEQQRALGIENFRETYNVAIITGPSKTADIGGILVMGVHGPGEVHVVLVP